VAAKAKTLSFEISLDQDWTATTDKGGTPLPFEKAWSPEHLVLVGLTRCVLTSLRYHARRTGIEVRSRGDAHGEVRQRDSDGRYAFVHLRVALDVTLEPTPSSVRELIGKAERDCFVGASLTARPRYHWIVNGEELR
jgi:organic hydroperoxide reductase OsmC/OhrA